MQICMQSILSSVPTWLHHFHPLGLCPWTQQNIPHCLEWKHTHEYIYIYTIKAGSSKLVAVFSLLLSLDALHILYIINHNFIHMYRYIYISVCAINHNFKMCSIDHVYIYVFIISVH